MFIKIDALLEDAAGEQAGGPRRGSDFQNLHRKQARDELNLKAPKASRCSGVSRRRPT
jgi:formyl-CoA transferase